MHSRAALPRPGPFGLGQGHPPKPDLKSLSTRQHKNTPSLALILPPLGLVNLWLWFVFWLDNAKTKERGVGAFTLLVGA